MFQCLLLITGTTTLLQTQREVIIQHTRTLVTRYCRQESDALFKHFLVRRYWCDEADLRERILGEPLACFVNFVNAPSLKEMMAKFGVRARKCGCSAQLPCFESTHVVVRRQVVCLHPFSFVGAETVDTNFARQLVRNITARNLFQKEAVEELLAKCCRSLHSAGELR